LTVETTDDSVSRKSNVNLVEPPETETLGASKGKKKPRKSKGKITVGKCDDESGGKGRTVDNSSKVGGKEAAASLERRTKTSTTIDSGDAQPDHVEVTTRGNENQTASNVTAVTVDAATDVGDGTGTGNRSRRKRTRQISDSQTGLLQQSNGLDSSNGSTVTATIR
jgi:hypothetical protein